MRRRRMRPLAQRRTGAAMVAAALLLCGEARAQASSGGPLSLFDAIFTRPLPQAAPPAPRPSAPAARAPREGGTTPAPPAPAAPPPPPRRNISQQSFQRFTAGLAPDLRIMDLMDSQPEFTKSIWDYLDILVNHNRLVKGREILAK